MKEDNKEEIDDIISKGLEPKRCILFLKNMYRQVGIKYLFRDGLEIVLLFYWYFFIFFLYDLNSMK